MALGPAITILSNKAKLYPVWFAADSDKVICAQTQQDAIDAFKVHYGRPPSIVFNGLYAARLEAKDATQNFKKI